MIDLRTEKKKERDARDIVIADYFKSLCKEHPNVAKTRIMKGMAQEGKHGIHSLLGLRQILIRTKVYTPTKRCYE